MNVERAKALKHSIAAAVITFLIALEPLCAQTYSLVFADKAPLAFTNSLGRSSPIPKSLEWSSFTESLVFRLGTLPAGFTVALHLVLWLTLVFLLLRLLNSTFRLTSGVDWDKDVLTHTYMHTPPLIKVFLITVSAAIPAIAVHWLFQTILKSSDISILIRACLAGAACWVLFGRAGIAGDCEMGNYELPRERRTLGLLLLRGAVAGLVGFAIYKAVRSTDTIRLFEFFMSLGAVGEQQWRTILLISCGGASLLAFGFTLAVSSLSKDAPRLFGDLKGLVTGAAIVLLTGLAIGWWLPKYERDRYDFSPKLAEMRPTGMTVGAEKLKKKCNLAMPPKPETAVLMLPNGPSTLSVVRGSVALLDLGPESVKRITDFLKSRDYVTALSDPAYKTLHDAASLQWDTAESLRLDYLKLTKCPDAQFMSIFTDKLRSCAATPENVRFADMLADEKVFTFPSRDSEVLMGDIYARLGERKKAEAWYRRAEVPAGRMHEILDDRTMFSTGVVTGKITVNGKPAAGYRVGLFPSLVTGELFRSMLVPGIFRPFWLRWIGTKTLTAADGSFKLDHVVASNYSMIVSGPDLKMRPFSRRLDVKNAPGEIFIGFGRPSMDLGEIALTILPPREPFPAAAPSPDKGFAVRQPAPGPIASLPATQ